MNQSNRRDFLKQSLAFAGYLAIIPALASWDSIDNKTILLRSSWQVENIGDIGHTPGVLALIEKYLPHVNVRLWPGSVGSGVEEMLMMRFHGSVPLYRFPRFRQMRRTAWTQRPPCAADTVPHPVHSETARPAPHYCAAGALAISTGKPSASSCGFTLATSPTTT